jgi:hypothetical protein
MERLWSLAVATGRKPGLVTDGLNMPRLSPGDCHRLSLRRHGKEGNPRLIPLLTASQSRVAIGVGQRLGQTAREIRVDA